jgi:two-component system, sensor histidine kinase RegB
MTGLAGPGRKSLSAAFAQEPEGIGREARRLRLNTLIGLRWLAVAGQTGAIAFVALALDLKFPVLACLGLVAASAALNLALRWRFPRGAQLTERGAAVLLAYDVLQLAGLLFLTGGVANPFVILLVAPVTIAATSLTLAHAGALLALALVCATALLRFNMPLPWIGHGSLELPALYVEARWVALAISAAFVALYAYRVAAEARQTASALAATELALARAQHLSQLDGLAAAAAHELGTPLGTVALVAREMAATKLGSEFSDDLHILEESVERCRAILGKLSSPEKLSNQQLDISSPVELAEMAAAPHRLLGVAIVVAGSGPDRPPACAPNPGVISGLGNLIENAVSFAESAVTIRCSWTKSAVTIEIADDGAGFPPNVLARAGEPFLSQRDAARRNEEAGGGLGLGLFIAQTLLERSRATLSLANAKPPATGAVATVEWSRAAYEQGRRANV